MLRMALLSRSEVAARAMEYRAGRLSYREFLDAEFDDTDDDVAELLDLLENEPGRGGWHGVSHEIHESYMSGVDDVIARLED